MNIYIKTILSLFIIGLLYGCGSSNESKVTPVGIDKSSISMYDLLSEGFVSPPMSSRPGAYWCWLNGDVTKESLTNDLEEMKAKGMGRAEIWDVQMMLDKDGTGIHGPKFLGPKSVDYIKHAMSEGKRLGIKIGMIASSGWNAGGSWVTPDWATKALYFSDVDVQGGNNVQMELPFPKVEDICPKDSNGNPVWYKEVCVIAVPKNEKKQINSLKDIIILNDHFVDGKLNWNAPKGDWNVMRFICSNTGQTLVVPSKLSDGLFIDFLDPKATKRHLGYILSQLGITKENAAESGLSYLEFDSMELDHATAWTDAMDSIFMARNGFDVLPYLPVFAGWELPEGNDDFLYSFNKTISDQLIFSHYTTGTSFLKEYGMDLVAEAGGPGPPIWNSCPVDALKALGNVSIPRGEFWIQHRNMFLIKEVSSASHIYGLEPVDAESFTTWRRWKDSPYEMKPYVDRAFCEGLNTITFHTFANTRPEHGLPGRAYHAGSDINSTTTWWESAKPFMDYLSRTSYILKQGQFVADVAYYYGDKAPNFFPEFHDVPTKPELEGLSLGYDFDLVNSDVILNRMSVEDGRIVFPDGMNYSLLVLPNIKDIPNSVVDKIETFIELGAKVLVQNEEIAQKIKGSIFTNMSIDNALGKLNIIKDFSSDKSKLDYVHRKIGNNDVYFVRNKTKFDISETCSFRVKNGHPEFWDPVTAERYIIFKSNHKDDITTINVDLPAHGSCFIVFTDSEDKGLQEYKGIVKGNEKEIVGEWHVSFPPNWGAPEYIKLDKLDSWINHDIEGVRHFSGTATYTNHFEMSKEMMESNGSINIDLGEVLDVAVVSINGRVVDTLWTKPFVSNIWKFLKAGNNQLEVRITNMWINRLTGDIKLPIGKKYCRTNLPDIIEIEREDWTGDEKYKIQDAGLLGPVRLIYE